MLLKTSDWMNGGSPDDVLFLLRDTPITRSEIRRRVSVLAARLSVVPCRTVGIAERDPVKFLTELIATLASRRTPVLAGGNRLASLEPAPDAVWAAEGAAAPAGSAVIPSEDGGDAAMDLPPISPDAELLLFTSGTTGKPKPVRKIVRLLDREAEMVSEIFPDLRRLAVASSVDPLHLYGLTFTVWVPMALGLTRIVPRLEVPEDLASVTVPSAIISSPTFLRYLDPAVPHDAVRFSLSAGGKLGSEAGARVKEIFGIPASGIYGSTETGVVAFTREAGRGDAELAPGVSFIGDPRDGRIRTPLTETGEASLDDRIEPIGPRTFRLLGRRDRIVKIAEERVSLDEIEKTVLGRYDFHTVTLAVTLKGRQAIGIAVDQSRSPEYDPTRVRQYERELRKLLKPAAVPRFWRSLAVLPQNTQGKTDMDAVRSLFEETMTTELLPKIKESTPFENGKVSVTFDLEPELGWFKGHFDAQPILPGVAQLELVTRFASQFAGPAALKEVVQMKFTTPMTPGDTVRLTLASLDPEFSANVKFDYQVYRNGSWRLASIGRLKLCKAA